MVHEFGLPWVAGDIVGCGIKLDGEAYSGEDKTRVRVFFTVNGQKVSDWIIILLHNIKHIIFSNIDKSM